jgi:5-formyltetrahydrofolate cyclo-ligase
MNWLVILLIAVAFGVLVRIYMKVRTLRNAPQEDWDSKTIERLRRQGSDPFKAHEVDFFFGLPNEEATRAVNAQLEAEGYAVDVKATPENTDYPYSLHARKSMRLSVPDMREIGRGFGELAQLHSGHYDGWAADIVK